MAKTNTKLVPKVSNPKPPEKVTPVDTTKKLTREIKIKEASDADLLAWYNENSGSKPVESIKDRVAFEKKCTDLREAVIALSSGTSKPSEQKKKDAKAKDSKKEKGDGAKGRKSSNAGKIIRVADAKAENPRRPETHGHTSYEIVKKAGKDGISYEDYIKKGGRPNDLAWDLERGWAKVSDK